MKTCLYQPIFINPQAYFVFPSLYHIEKGDSFIEPANITGQLIINTLTDDPTLTPIILTVKDNNQVDFSIFAGKHIRISQYTDEGAVVLGEWLMPGEPAPVYPDWFNDSLVCWYSPRKQKLTEYDVIESYAEDFTNWTYFPIRGTATITSNTIIITESKGINNILEDKVEPYSDISIYVTGVTEDTYIIVRDRTGRRGEIKKNGKYTFKNNDLFFGFSVNKIGECNITIKQLPTSILKDFSGNGLDAYMYGFQGKLNSGMGVYQQDFTNTRNATTVSSDGFEVAKKGGTYLARISIGYWNNKECKLLFETNNTTQFYYIRYRKANNDIVATVRLYNGENIIPAQDDLTDVSEVIFEGIVGDNEYIRVTEIPDYPNQLCYSGKEYCISFNQPILTDYTVIADRTWFENEGNRVFITKGNIWPNCAFVFEKINASLGSETFSFSKSTNIDDLIGKSGITYQTKQSYNGKIIGVGTSSDGDILLIGGQLKGEYIGCHSDFLLFNRTLNEDEINWLKENIYNIEI